MNDRVHGIDRNEGNQYFLKLCVYSPWKYKTLHSLFDQQFGHCNVVVSTPHGPDLMYYWLDGKIEKTVAEAYWKMRPPLTTVSIPITVKQLGQILIALDQGVFQSEPRFRKTKEVVKYILRGIGLRPKAHLNCLTIPRTLIYQYTNHPVRYLLTDQELLVDWITIDEYWHHLLRSEALCTLQDER